MKRLAWVMGAVLAVGCEKPATDFGAALGKVTVLPLVVLVADANRNGTIDFDDTTETTLKTAWDATHGAIMLANIDDDSLRCMSTDGAGALLVDDELSKCNDGADLVINGELDLLDLAPLGVQAWVSAPDATTGSLLVDPRAAGHVNLFIKRNGAYAWFDWQHDRLTTEEVRAGATLAIEATDIVRDTARWDGFVTVTLSIAGKSDEVKLRVAPVITQHHLADEKQVFVTAFATDPDSRIMRTSLQDALTVTATPLTDVDGDATFDGFTPFADQWTQDFFEVAYMSMPTRTGNHVIDVFIRSSNVYYPDYPNDALRDAGKVVFAKFRGRDAAGVVAFDLAHHNADSDSLNSYGNLETIPPFSLGGVDYPLGRQIRGNTTRFGTDPALEKLLVSQGMQPSVYVDTEWLLVGHIDETVSFVKAPSPRGWVMLVNDPALAKQMLEAQVTAGNGAVKMFVGQKWVDDQGVERAADVSISDVLANVDVMAESAATAAHVDTQVQIIKTATGLTDAEIIRVPYLHEPVMGTSLAYQPGTVNGLVFAHDTFGAPEPHGPIIDGKDIFKTQLEMALQPIGIKVAWVEEWNLYHRLSGELHCATNSRRDATKPTWWTSGR